MSVVGPPDASNGGVGDLAEHLYGMRKHTLQGEIVQLSKVTRDLLHAADPATRKAVLLLISHTSGLSQKKVKIVLEAASQLARKYVP